MLSITNIYLIFSIVLLIISICIYKYYNKYMDITEYYDYSKLLNIYNTDGYRHTPYTKSQYEVMEKTDPGFGYHMWQFEYPVKFNMNELVNYSDKWKDGDFGKLVSYLEDRNMAPAIKNLSV